jgi:hypothetical protein
MGPYDKVIAKIEQGWTQGAAARDADGNQVGVHSPKAVCWCIAGATVASFLKQTDDLKLENNIRKVTGYSSVTFNDAPGRTKEEVIEALKKARDLDASA